MLAIVTAGAAAQQPASRGELTFNNHCRTCHSIRAGDHRQGPSLHGILGTRAGSSDYPGYSDSMKNAGFTWDEARLDEFIANPDQIVPNNKMKPYAGLTDANVRRQIIEHLRAQQNGS